VVDVFHADPNYLDNEEAYKSIKEEVLGEESGESGSDEDEGSEESEDSEGGCGFPDVECVGLVCWQCC